MGGLTGVDGVDGGGDETGQARGEEEARPPCRVAIPEFGGAGQRATRRPQAAASASLSTTGGSPGHAGPVAARLTVMWEHLTRNGVLLTRDLLADGYSAEAIRVLAARGELVSLRRGAWLPAGQDLTREQRHALVAAASALLAPAPVMVSHTSAALLHGLPTWQVPLDTVHLMHQDRGRSRTRAGLRWHRSTPGVTPVPVPVPVETVGKAPGATVPAGRQQESVAGVSPARVSAVPVADAIVGYALLEPPGSDHTGVLVAADAALHRKLVTRTDLDAALARHVAYPGHRRAAAALRHADGRHESPGESRLAVDLRVLHVSSTPQVTIVVRGRAYRVDRLLEEAPVILEFDGRVKYTEFGSVMAEKRREDDLRSLGYGFVRVYWEHLGNLTWLADRIAQATRQRTAPIPVPQG